MTTQELFSLTDKLNQLHVQPDCDGADGFFGSVEAHPEGSDRGGYVPTLDAGPYFDEGGSEWCS